MSEPYAFTAPMVSQAQGIAVTNALTAQQQQQQRQQTLQTAGNALTDGDYSGAAGDLYKAGDLQGGLQFDTIAKGQAAASAEADTAQKQQLAKFTAETMGKLGTLRQSLAKPGADPNAVNAQTLAAFDQVAPQFKSMGETDEDLAQVRSQLAQNPDATITMLGAGAAKSLGYDVKVVNGQVVVTSKDTGNARLAASSSPTGGAPAAAPAAPAVTQDQANPDASFLAPQSVSPGVAGPGGAGAAPAVAGTARGDRNNNPLNLTVLPNGQTWDGQTGLDGNYVTFSSPEAGFAAADKNLQAYSTRHGINTLSGIIQRWAPTGDGNDPAAYAATVAKALGVDPNATLDLSDPQVRQGVLQAMAGVELGHPYSPGQPQAGATDMADAEAAARAAGLPWNPAMMRGTTPAALAYQAKVGGTNGAPAAQNAGVGTVDANGVLQLAPPVAKWTPDGQGALVNSVTGDRKKDPSFHAPGDDDSVLNDDAVHLLAGKYLNNGTLPPLGMGPIAAANRNKILNAATGMAKDLGLSADDLVAGTANVKALGSALTKAQGNWTAMSRQEEAAQANANLMLGLAPKGGGQTNIPVVNRWLQAGRKQIAGDPDVTAFDSALGGYSEEFAKVMTGSSGSAAATDSARAAAADRLSKYATQGQLAAGVATMNQEMANQKNAASHVIVGITNQIHGGGRGVPELAPAPAFPAPAPGAPPPANTPAPPVGYVNKQGYRYNGGDPHSAASWSR